MTHISWIKANRLAHTSTSPDQSSAHITAGPARSKCPRSSKIAHCYLIPKYTVHPYQATDQPDHIQEDHILLLAQAASPQFLFVISGVSDNMNLVVLALVINGALAGNIVEEIEKEPELSNFLEMVEKAGFLDVLKSEGPFSVIAPMNSGFRLVQSSLNVFNFSPPQETASPCHRQPGQ